jgi:hypothetical protein
VIKYTDPVIAERHVRRALDLARDAESTIAALSALIGYRRNAGDLDEALRLTERLLGIREQTGAGPATWLIERGNYLQLLLDTGRAEGYWPRP